jgi:uncharacterized protein YecE (DUF72 family)
MDLRCGTSGFSYAEWKGNFYPDAIAAEDMLGHYAGRLNAVEINNTFYRMPRSEVLQRWADAVPPDFRFVLKASRRITHQQRLADSKDSIDYLWDKALTLGPRLGPILFQLPPNMKLDLERLADFLKTLPDKASAAFEFRHDSWLDDRAYSLLQEHGHALCLSDTESGPAEELIRTASWCYLRLRRDGYSDGELRGWLERLQQGEFERAYVFFKHEEGGAAPAMAARMQQLGGE